MFCIIFKTRMELYARNQEEREDCARLTALLPEFMGAYYRFLFGYDEDSIETIEFFNKRIPYPYEHTAFSWPWRIENPSQSLDQLYRDARMDSDQHDAGEIISYCVAMCWAQFVDKFKAMFIRNNVNFSHDRECEITIGNFFLSWPTTSLAPFMIDPYTWDNNSQTFLRDEQQEEENEIGNDAEEVDELRLR